jgi:hypothetical protein
MKRGDQKMGMSRVLTGRIAFVMAWEKDVSIKRLGFGLSQLTLPTKATGRLHIETGEIRKDSTGRTVAPYASIIYDLDGATWVYSEVAPQSYLRKEVEIDRIKGDDAVLKSGPPPGTKVVTVGGIELYGAEVGVNGE